MEKSIIGQMAIDMDYNQVCEEFIKGGMTSIKVRYMGDNLVLLTSTE